MSMFGWSLPPGCGALPGEGAEFCEVCGQDIDSCPCPACPVCQCCGAPECYTQHGMVRTPEQLAALVESMERERAQAERDAAESAYWADPARQVEEQQFLEEMTK